MEKENHHPPERLYHQALFLMYLAILVIILNLAPNEIANSKSLPINEMGSTQITELEVGTEYKVNDVSKFIELVTTQSETLDYEKSWLCIQNDQNKVCLDFGIAVGQANFRPDWESLRNFLEKNQNSTDSQLTWIHNHPLLIQETYNTVTTLPPGKEDLAMYVSLKKLINQYFPNSSLQAVIISGQNKPKWRFSINDADISNWYTNERKNGSLSSYSPQEFPNSEFNNLLVGANQDWTDQATVDQAIREFIEFLEQQGVELEIEG